jgi:hypothetical protein
MRENPDAPRGWSLENFAKFWAKPDITWVQYAIQRDVVAYFPWSPKPVRGCEDYTKGMATVLAIVPDITLEVVEHAANGNIVFVHWLARGTGAKGPFELPGVDRFLLRDGLVAETRVFFDSGRFRAAIGRVRVPYRLAKFMLFGKVE